MSSEDMPSPSDLKQKAKDIGKKAEKHWDKLAKHMPDSREEMKMKFQFIRMVQANFAIQVVLTAMAWAVMFITLHHNIAKVKRHIPQRRGNSVSPTALRRKSCK
eukprot:scaffold648786_cov47-Prasinocladus_malaysianus.AAC.1